MSDEKRRFSRRELIKVAGVAGLGSTLLPIHSVKQAIGAPSAGKTNRNKVPTRPFGKSGVDVSILSLGGGLSPSDQLIYRQAFKMGVTYWDTADWYVRGKNEKAIGKYFAKYPEDRQKVFLVTKSSKPDPQKLTEKLEASLRIMNTSYIDMYFIQSVDNAKEALTKEVKAWAERKKAQGKIHLFGFAAHKNMEKSMLAAAKLGWVDGIMISYNYRLMVKDEMKKAVDACVKAGIGLTAMKTQAAFSANFYASIGSKTDEALKMTENFIKKGYTAEQANLKAVWENPNIASICSAIKNMTILQANVAAAVDNPSLSDNDRQRLHKYAEQTAPGYCAGCADICESAIDLDIPICDLMRYSMYFHSYGDHDVAREQFKSLPAHVKFNLLTTDYKTAERRCPQGIPIGEVLHKTYRDLA